MDTTIKIPIYDGDTEKVLRFVNLDTLPDWAQRLYIEGDMWGIRYDGKNYTIVDKSGYSCTTRLDDLAKEDTGNRSVPAIDLDRGAGLVEVNFGNNIIIYIHVEDLEGYDNLEKAVMVYLDQLKEKL